MDSTKMSADQGKKSTIFKKIASCKGVKKPIFRLVQQLKQCCPLEGTHSTHWILVHARLATTNTTTSSKLDEKRWEEGPGNPSSQTLQTLTDLSQLWEQLRLYCPFHTLTENRVQEVLRWLHLRQVCNRVGLEQADEIILSGLFQISVQQAGRLPLGWFIVDCWVFAPLQPFSYVWTRAAVVYHVEDVWKAQKSLWLWVVGWSCNK